jgi:hypothetical protein
MTMKTKILVLLAALLGTAATEREQQPGLAKVTVTAQVVNELDAPLAGATVKFVFGEQYDASAIVRVEGITGDDGRFTGEGYSDGIFGATVIKDGYYPSGLSVPTLSDIVNRKPQTVLAKSILRPIGKPVALYVKGGWFEIPVIGAPCGYDLEIGDWVPPYGKGAIADLIIQLERRYASRDDFEVTAAIRFSQPLDGIQEVELPAIGCNSVFKWQREAPEAGYQPVLTTRFAHRPGSGFENSASEDNNYFFRVRTVASNGKVVSALYGKIRGGLQLAPSHSVTSKIRLNYYLNPTPLDRNLEWETRHNLFVGPSDPDTPRDP